MIYFDESFKRIIRYSSAGILSGEIGVVVGVSLHVFTIFVGTFHWYNGQLVRWTWFDRVIELNCVYYCCCYGVVRETITSKSFAVDSWIDPIEILSGIESGSTISQESNGLFRSAMVSN